MGKLARAVMAAGLLFLAACGGGSGSSGSTGGNTGGNSGGNSGGSNPISNSATVDFGASNQTIRGFGGADAFMPALPGAATSALFGTGANDLGLTILRGRIDPVSTANWSSELANAQAAIAAGSNVSIIAAPWTPPAAMKSNSYVVMGSLNPGSYAAYAAYLESYVTYMANGGVNLYGISMQNEPDANVTYESCVWTPQQMDTWVAQNASVLTTRLIMPESESFTTAYSDPALNDPSAVGHIGLIAGHLYGTSPANYTNAVNAGKEVWMTEHYLTPAGTQPAIADALQAALEIHYSMTAGNYNAYVWWWAVDWNPGTGVTNYGLVDANNVPTYYGWALAQFSRFVRPGYVRANATSSANVYLSAYKGGGHFVIVAINLNSSPVTQTVTIQNQAITSMTPYETTSSATVAQQSAVSVSGNQLNYTLPAQSIVTFVQ